MAYYVDMTQSSLTRVNIRTVGNGSASKQENYEIAQLACRVAVMPDSPFSMQGHIEIFKAASGEVVATFDESSGSVNQTPYPGDLPALMAAVKALLSAREKRMTNADLDTTGDLSDAFATENLQSCIVIFVLSNMDESISVGFRVSANNVDWTTQAATVYTNEGAYSLALPRMPYVKLDFRAQQGALGNAQISSIVFSGY